MVLVRHVQYVGQSEVCVVRQGETWQEALSVLKLNVWGCTLMWLFSHCVQSLESEGGHYDMVSY